MKKIISLAILNFATFVCFSQSSKPAQIVFEEFSRRLNYSYTTNDAMKFFLVQTITRQNPLHRETRVGSKNSYDA